MRVSQFSPDNISLCNFLGFPAVSVERLIDDVSGRITERIRMIAF